MLLNLARRAIGNVLFILHHPASEGVPSVLHSAPPHYTPELTGIYLE